MTSLLAHSKVIKCWNANSKDCFIWIHGWMSCSVIFKKVISNMMLMGDHVLIDLPGVSILNPVVDCKMKSAAEFGKALENDLSGKDFCQYERIFLVGHSYGGKVCIKANNPKVGAKILIGVPIFSMNTFFVNARNKAISFMVKLGKLIERKSGFEIPEFLKRRLRSEDYDITSLEAREILNLTIKENLLSDLSGQKDNSILCIYGECDKSVDIRIGKISSSLSKNFEFVEFKNCDHYQFFDLYSDIFVDRVSNFIKHVS